MMNRPESGVTVEWLRDNSKESECDLQLVLTSYLLMQAHFHHVLCI